MQPAKPENEDRKNLVGTNGLTSHAKGKKMLGALISAGSSLLGGFMQNRQADKQAALQKQFAKNGIQWKVEDAKKAGIHPLYALGANTVSYAPQQVGDMGISAAGQDIGRAIDTGLTSTERANSRLTALTVERAELENAKLATEIALLKQPGHPPPPATEAAVIPGQGNAVEYAPHKVFGVLPTDAGITAGAPAETSLYATPGGGYTPAMSEVYAEGAGEGIIGQVEHFVRNKLPPFFGAYHKGLPKLPDDQMWIWNPISLSYVKTYKPGKHPR